MPGDFSAEGSAAVWAGMLRQPGKTRVLLQKGFDRIGEEDLIVFIRIQRGELVVCGFGGIDNGDVLVVHNQKRKIGKSRVIRKVVQH